MRALILLATLPLLAGCLPAAGPKSSTIVAAASTAAPSFDIVPLDVTVADTLAANEHESLAESFGTGGAAPDLRIGIGDSVIVTVFEAASGGLFSGEAGTVGSTKSVSLPAQPVARNGMITVPYVGMVKAAELTPAEVQASIEASLRDKAIEPQVVVTVAQSASTFVTVMGDIGSPGRIPLNLSGDRLLDVIATAGGSKGPIYETSVRLTRGSKTVTVSMSRIVEDPAQNIYLQPEDQVHLIQDPRIFTAFGATGSNSTFTFDTHKLTLAEAVGRAGGIQDSRADASGVFVFRYEKPGAYATVSNGDRPPAQQTGGVPVVYQLDLKQPGGYFAAQRFVMRDNDVIYVSNARSADLQKFFGLLSGSIGATSSTTGLAGKVY